MMFSYDEDAMMFSYDKDTMMFSYDDMLCCSALKKLL